MSRYMKPKYASRDAHDGPWVTCDTCGFLWSQTSMAFQYQYMGTSVPQNTGRLKCPKCMDPLQYQNKLLIIPPDPAPKFNIRPEPYAAVDELGPVQELLATVVYADDDIPATFFLDLYGADPAAGGTSVLSTLTGSATRTNYASVMTGGDPTRVTNASAITITDAAVAGAYTAWVVIFDAATSGTILMSAPLLPAQTISMWNGAQFATGALTVALNSAVDGLLLWGSDNLTWGSDNLVWS